jgi:hypothetical protein
LGRRGGYRGSRVGIVWFVSKQETIDGHQVEKLSLNVELGEKGMDILKLEFMDQLVSLSEVSRIGL